MNALPNGFFVATIFKRLKVKLSWIFLPLGTITGKANYPNIGTSWWSAGVNYIQSEISKISAKWVRARMALTIYFVKYPSIAEKHFQVIECQAVLMAKLLCSRCHFMSVASEGCSRFWPKWIFVSFSYAFLAFALLADRVIILMCHIVVARLSGIFPKEIKRGSTSHLAHRFRCSSILPL